MVIETCDQGPTVRALWPGPCDGGLVVKDEAAKFEEWALAELITGLDTDHRA